MAAAIMLQPCLRKSTALLPADEPRCSRSRRDAAAALFCGPCVSFAGQNNSEPPISRERLWPGWQTSSCKMLKKRPFSAIVRGKTKLKKLGELPDDEYICRNPGSR